MTAVQFKPQPQPVASQIELSSGQQAVTSIQLGQVAVVLGAPGSGKTTAIIQLVKNLIAQGLDPANLLVLAASRESANKLRDTLAVALQMATPGALAKTISSYAFGLIRQRALQNNQPLPQLISGSEQDRILAQLLQEVLEQDIDELGFPSHINRQVISLAGFRAELRDLITVAIEHGVTPEALRQLAVKHSQQQWQASAILYERYLQQLAGSQFRGRFDSTSLLHEAATWLGQNPQDIKFVIVDDAQELTPAANKLLALLGQTAGLVLVGDPDSATLGFRSADPRSMSNLAEAVAAASGRTSQTIVLEANVSARPAQIASVLARVSRQIDTARAGRQRKGLNSLPNEEASTAVEGQVFISAQAESAWLARRLRELHLYQGIAWQDMAVVTRSRSTLEQFAAALSHEQVPVHILGAQAALRDEFASRMLLLACDYALNPRQLTIAEATEMLSSALCGLDSLGLRRLRRSLRREELSADGSRNSDELILQLFEAEGSLATVAGAEAKRAGKFLKTLFEAQKLATEAASIEELLWHFWSNSGLEKTWFEQARGVGQVALQANRNLDAVVALFAAANRFVERNPNLAANLFVQQQLALGLPEDSLALGKDDQLAVALTTPAGLIGRRYQVVALPGLEEGVWPNLRPRNSLLGATALDGLQTGRIEDPAQSTRSELPDELRMLYKTIGAADSKLLISAAESQDAQLSQFIGLILGQIPEAVNFKMPQLTLRGAAGYLRRNLATAQSAESSTTAVLGLARLAAAGVVGAHPSNWYGLVEPSTVQPLTDLQDPEASVYLRPSQLENFLKCPLHWFLNAHGASDSAFSAHLGTLVHSIFEQTAGEAALQSEEQLWQLVESKWHTIDFESAWLAQAGERKAKQMISNMVQYLRKFNQDGGRVLGSEVNFQFQAGRALVSGQVDRIEQYPDGTVVIVDLKTGSKSFSAAEAVQHPQLGLYQLAFQNGAFQELFQDQIEAAVAGPAHLGGAKLVLIGDTKPVERQQPSLADDPAFRAHFEELIATATNGMAMTDKYFVAQVGSHCQDQNQYGSCQLHLIEAVTFVG